MFPHFFGMGKLWGNIHAIIYPKTPIMTFNANTLNIHYSSAVRLFIGNFACFTL